MNFQSHKVSLEVNVCLLYSATMRNHKPKGFGFDTDEHEETESGHWELMYLIYFILYRFLKRSTLPIASTILCSPV